MVDDVHLVHELAVMCGGISLHEQAIYYLPSAVQIRTLLLQARAHKIWDPANACALGNMPTTFKRGPKMLIHKARVGSGPGVAFTRQALILYFLPRGPLRLLCGSPLVRRGINLLT